MCAAAAAARSTQNLRALAAGPLPATAGALLLHADPVIPSKTLETNPKPCVVSPVAAAAARLLRVLCEDAIARPAAAAAAVAGGERSGAAGLAALVGMLEGAAGPGKRRKPTARVRASICPATMLFASMLAAPLVRTRVRRVGV